MNIYLKQEWSPYTFSNGTRESVQKLLLAAGISEFFIDIISVDEIKSYKPDPAVYHHFLARTGALKSHAWLISSNSFDVMGAISIGMNAAWLQRSKEVRLDPWGIEPRLIVQNFEQLHNKLLSAEYLWHSPGDKKLD